MQMDPASWVVEDLKDKLDGNGRSSWCCDREAFEESEVGIVSGP